MTISRNAPSAWIHLFPSPACMLHRYGIRYRLLVPLCYRCRWLMGLRGALEFGQGK